MGQDEYSSISSPYIRSRIASIPFEAREVIHTLVNLHNWIRHPPTTASSARAYDVSRQRYYGAWLALLREHNEDAYQAQVADNDQAVLEQQERLEREAVERRAKERAELEDWLRAGGLPSNVEPGE